jgi:hypothetical protein
MTGKWPGTYEELPILYTAKVVILGDQKLSVRAGEQPRRTVCRSDMAGRIEIWIDGQAENLLCMRRSGKLNQRTALEINKIGIIKGEDGNETAMKQTQSLNLLFLLSSA